MNKLSLDWIVGASDDVLARVAEVFSDPAIDACYGDLLYVDSKDTSRVVRSWHSGDFNSAKFYWGWMLPHPTHVFCSSLGL